MEPISENAVYIPDQPFLIAHCSHYMRFLVRKYGIVCFYMYSPAETMGTIRTVPTGCIDFIFLCDPQQPQAYAYGSELSHARIDQDCFQAGKMYFGVQFMPGYLPPVADPAMRFSDFCSSKYPLPELIRDKDLIRDIAQASSVSCKIERFMRSYMPLYHARKEAPERSRASFVAGFVRQQLLMDPSDTDVGRFALMLGVSERYVHRTFCEEFGLSPKLFASIVRFQNLLTEINHDSRRLTQGDIAARFGYYDKSHMNKDFRLFADITLRDYQRFIRSINYFDKLSVFPFSGDLSNGKHRE